MTKADIGLTGLAVMEENLAQGNARVKR